MAIKTLTFSQAARFASKLSGRPVTREDVLKAVAEGHLTTAPVVSRGLLEIDVMAWLDERADMLQELEGGQS